MSTHYLELGAVLCGKRSPGLTTTDLLPRVTCGMCLRIIARRAKPKPPNAPGMFSSQRPCPVCRGQRAVTRGVFVEHRNWRGELCAGSGAPAPTGGW